MKLLVLEKDGKITSIFRKIFSEKKYQVEFTSTELECLSRYDNSFDCVILENSKEGNFNVGEKIKSINHDQKILFLSPYLGSNLEPIDKERTNLIEKPFAILPLIAQLEISQNRNFH